MLKYLENYKFVVEAQDALLNKAIVKQNKLRNIDEINVRGSRFKILDDKEYIISSFL